VTLAGNAGAAPPPYAGAQFRYWDFTDGNHLRDWIVYAVRLPVHVQLEYWDFIYGQDQFRPEIGLHLPDKRGSYYHFEWRHERDKDRFTVGTEQKLTDHIVGRFSLSPIVHEHGTTETVVTVGADIYWGSYNFASVSVIKDPRGGELWSMPFRVRLANERNDWFQVTAVPTTERSFGWALDGKYRWVRAGLERNSRYDFTDVDNFITTIGIEVPIQRGE
jgi:hypothetical protein